MTYRTIRLGRDGGIATLTIDRPERRNALNASVRGEIISALDRLREAGDDVRVLVITGAGEKAFVAGADVAEFAERTPEEQEAVMAGRNVFREVASFPAPVIAMINGYALGGGCELALACDLRVAARSARMGQPEINLGLIPGGGGTQRLPRLVGTGGAMRLILTGELIDAEEAHRLGLVDLLVEDAELEARTRELARSLAERSPLALKMAKLAVHAAAEMPLAAGLGLETERFLACFASEDGREGVTAFLEKRSPRFRGR